MKTKQLKALNIPFTIVRNTILIPRNYWSFDNFDNIPCTFLDSCFIINKL